MPQLSAYSTNPLFCRRAVDVAGHGLREHGMDAKNLQQLAGHKNAHQRRPLRMQQGSQNGFHGTAVPYTVLPGLSVYPENASAETVLARYPAVRSFPAVPGFSRDHAADAVSEFFYYRTHNSSSPTSLNFPSTASPSHWAMEIPSSFV